MQRQSWRPGQTGAASGRESVLALVVGVSDWPGGARIIHDGQKARVAFTCRPDIRLH